LKLRNTIANNSLNLFCLVYGETASQAFPVQIESTKTIGDLKKLIMGKKSSRFSNIDANELILWKASIPGGNSGSAVEIGSLVVKTLLDKIMGFCFHTDF
jgi:hypothetical protein